MSRLAIHRTHSDLQIRIQEALRSLPSVAKADIDAEESCAICLTPFHSIFEEELAEQKEEEGLHPAHSRDEGSEAILLGVTKVAHCGHVFCRRDLAEWIKGFHGNCPTCRHPFLDISPPSDSDDESSDGGEYVPNPADFEDEDNETVGFSEDFSEDLEAYGDMQYFEDLAREQQEVEALFDARDQEEESFYDAWDAEEEAIRAEQEEISDLLDAQEAEEEEIQQIRAEQEEIEALLDSQDALQDLQEQELAYEGLWEEENDMDLQESDALGEDFAAEALMDVYLSDSSSDLDYEPQDYMMSDTESDVMSSDFEYSIEELECFDQLGNPVSIHCGSSNSSLLALGDENEKVVHTGIAENTEA